MHFWDPAMAISVAIKKFNSREYVYIIDSYRDPVTKKPTSRNLVSYGRKDKLLAADPDAMQKVEKHAQSLRSDSTAYSHAIKENLLSGVEVNTDSITERPASLTCTPAIFHPLWEDLGMGAYFRNYKRNNNLNYDLEKTVFFSCVSRLIEPKSKHSSWLNRKRFITDFSDIDHQRMYDCLDVLAAHKDRIIRKLNQGIEKFYKRDLTVALYDVTTFYFESFNEDELRRRGMSKEHRTQETQVVLGLLIDSEGVPFAYELFPGNTAEMNTLITVIDKFRKQYQLKEVIVVADSGLNQLLNLDRLQKRGFKFIVGYPPYCKLKATRQKELLEKTGWNWKSSKEGLWDYKTMPLEIKKAVEDKVNKTKQQVQLSVTCVATYSEVRYHHDHKELSQKWNKAINVLNQGKAASATTCKSGYKAFIQVDTSGAALNKALYEKRLKWCGYSALLTNLDNPDPEWIYKKQRQLWRIEDNFRLLKTNLQARPVYVWTDEHIRGHFMLNYIALVMQKMLLKQLDDKGLHLSASEVIKALESMKINRLKGLKKANSNLYSCSNIEANSVHVAEGGEEVSLKELCDRILKACDAEPLNSLETASTIRKKLKIKLPIQ